MKKHMQLWKKWIIECGRVEDSVDKISQKLDSNYKELINVKTQPEKEKSKKVDKFVDYIFYTIVGAVLALIFAKIGLS